MMASNLENVVNCRAALAELVRLRDQLQRFNELSGKMSNPFGSGLSDTERDEYAAISVSYDADSTVAWAGARAALAASPQEQNVDDSKKDEPTERPNPAGQQTAEVAIAVTPEHGKPYTAHAVTLAHLLDDEAKGAA